MLALLAALYLVLWQGPDTLLGRTLFVAHLGLFMLWQPFVHAEQRLSVTSLLALAGVVLLAGAFLKGWMIALWIMMLAGIVGGKVVLFGARGTRLFYLLALAFLVVALLLMAAPEALPMAKLPEQILWLGYAGLPLVLVVMALLPQEQESDRTHEVVDFVYSLFVFLLLAVLMLGSLAAMLLLGSGYVEALLQTLLLMGTALLLLGWAWNPSSGFSGIGGLFSRYWMSIGLPIEQWLQLLSNLALQEEDPQVFLEQACARIGQRLPWVTGGEWIAGGNSGRFGLSGEHRWEFSHGGMVLVLYTPHALSPTLLWHFNLLAQFLAQLYADKQRALALKQLSYMQAIHETGARLTHDVKNLLQSLNALCSAGIEPGAESSLEYRSLLRRQLPAITERLAETLAKLNAPQSISSARRVSAAEWWRDLRQRMATLDWIDFKAAASIAGDLPAEVFSGVADNLIRNAAEKHLREPALRVQLELVRNDAGFELIVCDDGSAMAEGIVSRLFVGPVSSDTGYGIGLYHAARYAQAAGYRLELGENRTGRVCFRLALGT
ncbi:MAG: ATPase domain-containing protein [Rhodocyclaceae bacterium]|nr:MAG: ATPase domain-containing protein [Rhodocyclaceae bacterium]TND00796.1 MAG: ATPase domain-containing protein [Rhodocyclaceae bacterium]